MKKILVLGAGQSAPYLIRYLLDRGEKHGWFVTVGDLDRELARSRVGDHPHGAAIEFDVNDTTLLASQVKQSDLVVNLLSPRFQDLIAWECVSRGVTMVSASYRDEKVRAMDRDAARQGSLLLCEMGLDPGIDHMSAMALIRRIREREGRIVAFRSYGSGIPAPDQEHNPLRYVVTWNPRNVVMSGEAGAQYMENGKIKIVPYHHVFHHTWSVEVEGLGELEAYPNRDSLSYMQHFGLTDVHTMIRGTLRYPGWSETWAQIVALGLTNEQLRIPNLAERTYREVVEMFLPLNVTEPKIEQRIGRFLKISPTGRIMQNLRWLGLLANRKIGCAGETAAAMLMHLLQQRLPLTPDSRDMVVLAHELDVEFPGAEGRRRISSTLVAYGERGGFTAMATAVGLPAAIAAKLILTGKLPLTGSHIPTHPSIYEPVLREIEQAGMVFEETDRPLA